MNQTGSNPISEAPAGTLAVLHPGVEALDAPSAANMAVQAQAVEPRQAGPRLAPRLKTLRGKRLALFENGKVNALRILVAVGKRLEARHGIAQTQVWRKRHAGESGAAVIPSILAWKPDLVLTSTGD